DEGADSLTCDSLGCRYVTGDGTVFALVFDGRALAEDCALSDVVVSAVPVRKRCPGPDLVIDRFDLWRDGEGRVRVDSVRERRGARPWVAERGSR
ncbi:MAG: ComEC family competence protein, partial [Alphaproteobacteria bacterium]